MCLVDFARKSSSNSTFSKFNQNQLALQYIFEALVLKPALFIVPSRECAKLRASRAFVPYVPHVPMCLACRTCLMCLHVLCEQPITNCNKLEQSITR